MNIRKLELLILQRINSFCSENFVKLHYNIRTGTTQPVFESLLICLCKFILTICVVCLITSVVRDIKVRKIKNELDYVNIPCPFFLFIVRVQTLCGKLILKQIFYTFFMQIISSDNIFETPNILGIHEI